MKIQKRIIFFFLDYHRDISKYTIKSTSPELLKTRIWLLFLQGSNDVYIYDIYDVISLPARVIMQKDDFQYVET